MKDSRRIEGMTDRQKLLAALVSKPDSGAGARLSVLEVAAMLERLRADQREDALAS
jgi:hypothetical protein